MISLLIHGFLSVNARLLIAFGTAFYAITCNIFCCFDPDYMQGKVDLCILQTGICQVWCVHIKELSVSLPIL